MWPSGRTTSAASIHPGIACGECTGSSLFVSEGRCKRAVERLDGIGVSPPAASEMDQVSRAELWVFVEQDASQPNVVSFDWPDCPDARLDQQHGRVQRSHTPNRQIRMHQLLHDFRGCSGLFSAIDQLQKETLSRITKRVIAANRIHEDVCVDKDQVRALPRSRESSMICKCVSQSGSRSFSRNRQALKNLFRPEADTIPASAFLVSSCLRAVSRIQPLSDFPSCSAIRRNASRSISSTMTCTLTMRPC
jgi:hypothetical protein